MALGMNDFRSIVIKADAANTSIAPIRLSQNDQDGRRIVFELWNGAESIAATGLTARLLFGVGEGGYATMTAVTGAATATWAVDVPQEALQTAGVVRMAVEVASGSQAVCTRIFDAVVEPAIIDEDSPEAQDALSEFREAIARLEDFTVPVPIANGGTGATTAANARTALGITPANIGAIPLTGAAATGSLGVMSSNIDRDGANPSAQTGNTLYLCDKDGERIGMIRTSEMADGGMLMAFATYSEDGNGEHSNWFNLIVAKDGTCSMSVADAAAWRNGLGVTPANIGALATTGGTVNGSINLVGNEFIKSSNLESGVRPSVNTSGASIQYHDKNGAMVASLGPRFFTDGTQTIQLVASRVVNGATVNNGIVVGVGENGEAFYSVNNPRAWQKMLGCTAAQIAKNYSWTTTFTGSSCLVMISRGSYFAVGIIDYWSTSMNVVMQSAGAQSAGLPTIVKSANSYSFTITNDHNSVAIAVEVISIPMETVG